MLEWFESTSGSAWRERGFDDVNVDRAVAVGSLSHRRWAVRLWLRFLAGGDTPSRLEWAAQNGVIELD